MIPLAPAIMLGGSASVLAVAAVTLRHSHGRAPARPAKVSCLLCRQTFGGDDLRDAAKITYHWTPARGHTLTQLDLPHSTFLAACPHCAAEFEITPDGTIFHPPKTGILSYTRTGRLGITPAITKAAA
jgi:hypothetical protein